MLHALKTKRVYLPAEAGDGFRALVDRLWPRGLSREKAALDLWDKAVAPSAALRTWFAHDPARFAAFRSDYLAELAGNPAAAAFAELCRERLKEGDVTLLFGAKDPDHNQAVVLKEWLLSELGAER